MLEAVLFDLDGVIADSEPIHQKIEKKLFQKLGLRISDEEHASFVGTGGMNMWTILKEKYCLKNPIDELIKLKTDTYIQFVADHEDLKPVPGAVELVHHLFEKGVTLAVASSSSQEIIRMVIDRFCLKRFFMLLISGDAVGYSKPMPDIFLETARRIHVETKNCIVIEDSKNGVLAAKRAGMICIGLKNHNSGYQDLSQSDLVIDSLSKLNHQRLASLWNECSISSLS